MQSFEKITDVIKKSCEEIEKRVLKKKIDSNNAAEVIKNVVETFFGQLRESGYCVYLDEFLEKEHIRKSKKCIDIAKAKALGPLIPSSCNLAYFKVTS